MFRGMGQLNDNRVKVTDLLAIQAEDTQSRLYIGARWKLQIGRAVVREWSAGWAIACAQ